jgi:hypothetical protein
MSNENFIEKYIEDRLEKQIQYFSKKARDAKSMWQCLSIFSMVSGLAITAMTTAQVQGFNVICGMLASLSALASALTGFCKFNESWINARCMAEMLKREKFLFLGGAGKYEKVEGRNGRLVIEIERILGGEVDAWAENSGVKSQLTNQKSGQMSA